MKKQTSSLPRVFVTGSAWGGRGVVWGAYMAGTMMGAMLALSSCHQ